MTHSLKQLVSGAFRSICLPNCKVRVSRVCGRSSRYHRMFLTGVPISRVVLLSMKVALFPGCDYLFESQSVGPDET